MAAAMSSVVHSSVCKNNLQRAASRRAPIEAIAFQRPPGFARRARCTAKSACGPMGSFRSGIGPNEFAGRPLTPQDIQNMARDAEQFFSGKVPDSWASKNWSADTSTSQADMPLVVDVQEEADSFVFTADVPGVARSNVKVQARREERELLISGCRDAPERPESGKQYRSRMERRFGKFSRTFTLPENAMLTGITAKFDNGVLIVTVRKVTPKESELTDIPIDIADKDSIRSIDV